MNDTPTKYKLKGTEWELKGIKAGAAIKIADLVLQCEAAKSDEISDALICLAKDGELVAKCIAIALVNDYEKLKDEDYVQSVIETLMDCELKDWTSILIDVISSIDIRSFLVAINSVMTFKELIAGRKVSEKEVEQ